MATRMTDLPKGLRVDQKMVDAKIEELLRLYRGRKRRMEQILTGGDLLTTAKSERLKALLAQLEEEIRFLNKKIPDWSLDGSRLAYRQGQGVSGVVLLKEGITTELAFTARIHKRAVDVIAEQMAADLIGGNLSILRTGQRLIRKTQQSLIEDRLVSQRIAEGVISGARRRDVSDVIASDLYKKIADGKTLVINGRHYDPESYAELVARTQTREAMTQGTINTAVQYGVDLVRVSAHAHDDRPGDDCPLYAGKIFSISGEHPDFPKLVARPPFHPNGKHVITPVIEATLKRRGVYGRMVKFSNARIAA